MTDHHHIVEALLETLPESWAEQAGIDLADKPSPLYRLLVLTTLLSARISADVAVAATRELSEAGLATPQAMVDSTWQQRVDALDRGHYVRYDERTATMLGDGARLLLEEYGGDLRRLHEKAEDVAGLSRLLQAFPGIGPTGADIFCREVQAVWPDVAPFVDERALRGAELLGLPATADAISRLVTSIGLLPRLVGALERASRSEPLRRQVHAAAERRRSG